MQPTNVGAPAPKDNKLTGDVILPDIPTEDTGLRKDFLDESMFGVDDNVVLMNILDGTTRFGKEMPKLAYVFEYDGTPYRVQAGQQFSLPGSRAYLYVKHLTSLIYRRVLNKPEMDKRTYPLNDAVVSAMVVKINKTLNPVDHDRRAVVEIPDYVTKDSQIDPDTGAGGHLAGAMASTGGGDFELRTTGVTEPDATDDDIDNIPDFDPANAPRFNTEDGQVVSAAEVAQSGNDEGAEGNLRSQAFAAERSQNTSTE